MKKVIIYSTPTCQYCKMAKAYFKDQGVEYTEIDVAGDPAKAQEMIEKSGQRGVPVIDIDGQITVGFDRPTIASQLGLES